MELLCWKLGGKPYIVIVWNLLSVFDASNILDFNYNFRLYTINFIIRWSKYIWFCHLWINQMIVKLIKFQIMFEFELSVFSVWFVLHLVFPDIFQLFFFRFFFFFENSFSHFLYYKIFKYTMETRFEIQGSIKCMLTCNKSIIKWWRPFINPCNKIMGVVSRKGHFLARLINDYK